MTTVVISPTNVVTFPEGGGHFWAYMQYAQGLHLLGCEVYWLERFQSSGDQNRDDLMLSTFFERMERYGLGGKVILYLEKEATTDNATPYEYIGAEQSEAEAVFRQADFLLNFYYTIDPALLSYFRRTALVDIDPGLLQFWVTNGLLHVPQHDIYFTTGETVGTPAARFPDLGQSWVQIRPPVCLELWPYVYDANCEAFTTVSGWWAVGSEEAGLIMKDKQIYYANHKRSSFLQFMELPRMTSQVLELALCLGEGDEEDRTILENYGWRIRHAYEVADSPEMYQSYIQTSRGEFSCAKPSCMKFQNAWISDRTLCYLATGKPVVVQHTGPSSYLPNGEGMFRFSTMEETVDALATINADYKKHCQAARGIAEVYFDSKQIVEGILNVALR